MIKHLHAGDAEITIPMAGTVLMKGQYHEPTIGMMDQCIKAWCLRFGGPTPEVTETMTRECFRSGGLALVVTKKNKRSFRFAFVPTPMFICTVDMMAKDDELLH